MAKYLMAILIAGAIICAWCPWLKADEAQTILNAKIIQVKKENPNLCAIFINKNSLHKTFFGYTEEVSYDCTISDPIYGVTKSHDFVLITFYKNVLKMPVHTVKK